MPGSSSKTTEQRRSSSASPPHHDVASTSDSSSLSQWVFRPNLVTGANHERQTKTPHKYNCAVHGCSYNNKWVTLLSYMLHLRRNHGKDMRDQPDFSLLPVRSGLPLPAPKPRRSRSAVPSIPPHMRLPDDDDDDDHGNRRSKCLRAMEWAASSDRAGSSGR